MKITNSVIKKKTQMKPLDENSGPELVIHLFEKWIEKIHKV